MRVAILGLGNELLSDDGVGVHAARLLAADPPPGIEVLEIGTAVLDALPVLEEFEAAIAIDAIQAGRPPGTIYRLPLWPAAETPTHAPTSGACSEETRHGALSSPWSLHELDLAGVLRMIPEPKRPHVVVFGVEPASLDVGMTLSAPVQAALPGVVQAVREAASARA